ncbi:ATP-binding protein [Segetibacter koreensis]|uniref:ATP-binding protein n=1 Tax=Segetibacter koreensis TaxID=398037 RepID=UPI00036A660D|nr:ATP-binding protein [Segetibacter koreensis]
MIEIASVTLHNEMDLILANRRAMCLAELAGLSIGAQTTFATAVSEISRNSIEKGKNGCLLLGVADIQKKDKYIVAEIKDDKSSTTSMEGLEYAKKLADKFSISQKDSETSVELQFFIPSSHKLTASHIETWKGHFNNEPPTSPYEEIKRKNEQLQLVAAKLLESESQYKTLTNSLPIIIFSLNTSREVIYANDWFTSFTGVSIEDINASKWKNVVHNDDYAEFSILFDNNIVSNASVIKTQCRLKKAATNEYRWHLVSISPIKDERDNVLYWIGFLVDINAQKLVEKTLQENKTLEEAQTQLKKKEEGLQADINELNRSNTELSQFAFVASHDLQEPLRKIILYSDYLLNKYKDKVDKKGETYLKNMIDASHRMRNLIGDILSFSQVNNKQLDLKPVDLNTVALECIQDMEVLILEKKARVSLKELPTIEADAVLIRQLFNNIVSNALKYAKDKVPSRISIWCEQPTNSEIVLYFKDNGIGFEEKYMDKIFTLFQRLHGIQSYKGTGLGLAICRKIVQLHNGKIEAKSELGKGATFIVTMPAKYKAIN